MQLAAFASKLSDSRSTQRYLKESIDLLQTLLQQTPADVTVRLKLSRLMAAQGQILDSIFVLAEGCEVARTDELIDALIQRYTFWLSLLSTDEVSDQLEEIALALRYSANGVSESSRTTGATELKFSDGSCVSLPATIVEFHHALVDRHEAFLIPLLLGTQRAGRNELTAALELLERAHRAAPEHPVVANNLAWTLSQMAEAIGKSEGAKTSDSASDSQSPKFKKSSSESGSGTLDRAWVLSNLAVNACPDNAAFRETRGTIAAQTHRWKIAIDDLQKCADAGRKTRQVQTLLPLAIQRNRE